MALGDICLRFAWQAWHLWHWAGSGGALGLHWSPVTPRHFAWQAWRLVTSTFVSRGTRGPLGDIPFRFAWQAWHLWHWAGSGVTHHLCHTPSSHTTLSPTIFDTPSFTHHLSHHFVTRSLSHTTFTHTHTPSFTYNLVTHNFVFTSRSSTTSFVFPSFPVPATTFGAHCWKKLPCGVFRSFNFFPSYSTDHQVACSVISQLYPNFWRFKSHNNTH